MTIISYLTRQKTGQHLLFWIFTFVFLCFMEYSTTHGSISAILLKQIINISFYAIMAYVNIYVLIPQYFQDKRYPAYFLILILFVIIITPIYSLLLYLIALNDPIERFELLKLKNYYYFFNFFIIGASTVFVIIKDWIFQKREKRELENRNIQSELNFLKSQINPHFLFNTLNSLYALTLKKSEKAPNIVIKLSEMMRYMLYDCNEKFVPLEKEIVYLNNYIELEKLRQPETIHIDFRVEGETDDLKVAPLIFISFLENAFKHGISSRIDYGFVNISFIIHDKILEFKIENSKADQGTNKVANAVGGIGQINTKKRLEMIYPDQHNLKILDSTELYSVYLTINLNEIL